MIRSMKDLIYELVEFNSTQEIICHKKNTRSKLLVTALISKIKH